MNGTQLQNGLVLAQDDAELFERAGYDVEYVRVYCSARLDIAPPPSGLHRIAVDANGEYDHAHTIIEANGGLGIEPAIGHYQGKTNVSVVAEIHASNLERLHLALSRNLQGFVCFAVLEQVTA